LALTRHDQELRELQVQEQLITSIGPLLLKWVRGLVHASLPPSTGVFLTLLSLSLFLSD
jgi:hypothetical protein